MLNVAWLAVLIISLLQCELQDWHSGNDADDYDYDYDSDYNSDGNGNNSGGGGSKPQVVCAALIGRS